MSAPLHLVWTPRLAAETGLWGMALGLLGGLYLAYDLLGGRHGPLRSIARATAYLPLFLLGYLFPLGLSFALIAACGLAAVLAAEFHFTASGRRSKGLTVLTGVARGMVLGLAALPLWGAIFGIVCGCAAAAGLAAGNLMGLAPADDYEARPETHLRLHNLAASIYRTGVASAAALAAALVAGTPSPILLGLRIGLTVGVVSVLVGLFSPLIEARIMHAPERQLGLIGLGFILIGTALESIERWVVVFSGG